MSIYKEMWLDDQLFEGFEEEFLAIKEFYKKEWFQNDKLHRDGGPAVIYSDGYQGWYQNGKYHRIDGPAVIYSDGTQSWYQNGKLHREDGPAIIRSNGQKEWRINGVFIHSDEFRNLTEDAKGTFLKNKHQAEQKENLDKMKARKYDLLLSIFKG